MDITIQEFEEQRHPRFGNNNPERVHLPFWNWMIRGRYSSDDELDENLQKINDPSRLAYRPHYARRVFGVAAGCFDGPIWTFHRVGQSRSELPDGRLVYIGGEYEDSYDQDFWIYNDVVVFTPDRQIEVYCYPKDVFPSTDFHTATVVMNRIIVIGGLGYNDERRVGNTPVYALDLTNYTFSKIDASGDQPGWICDHLAVAKNGGQIDITGGDVMYKQGEFKSNIDEYMINAVSSQWARLTHKEVSQCLIRPDSDRMLTEEPAAILEAVYPCATVQMMNNGDQRICGRVVIGDITVTVKVRMESVEVIMEGHGNETLKSRLITEMRDNLEGLIRQACHIEVV